VEIYVILWEFVVPTEKVDAFVAAHKSDGAWAKLFAQAEGYLGTELLSSTEAQQEAIFLTIDRWRSAGDFTRFQEHFGAEYRALDTQFEGLTVRERKLGIFISEV
jgi:heme-degrading monooxygenase HmoA